MACPDIEAVDRQWARMVQANPRLHDGEVIAVAGADPASGLIECHRSSYKLFVAGAAAGVVVRSLGVTGVCVRRKNGVEEALIGRRGDSVRVYGGLWETAPRGGAEARGRSALNGVELAGCVLAEAEEELGAGISITPRRWLAIVRDPVASSVDLCLLCGAECDDDRAAETPGNWEYSARRWIPVDELRAWARAGTPPAGLAGERLSPPCVELVAWSGFSGFGDTRSSTL